MRVKNIEARTMKGQFTRLIIFMAVCVLLIAGVTAATYAVWTTSDGGSTPATTQTGEWDDPSFRYLVLEIAFSDGSSALAEYVLEDGAEVSAFDVGQATATNAVSATVVGYKGILTTLKIPPAVTVKDDAGQTNEISVTSIATGTVEQYDGFRLIKELEIPATVTSIADYSFMFCDSLEKVAFVSGGGALTMGKMCFYRCVNLDYPTAVDFGGRSVTQGKSCFEK